jgi:hypothetical protein
MDKLTLLKYICANDLPYKSTEKDLHDAQLHYYTNESIINIEFDPLDWACSNIGLLFEHCNVVFTASNNKTPISAFYDNECIFHNGLMKQSSLEVICKFYIKHKNNERNQPKFNPEYYYSLYYDIIDKFATLYDLHQTAPTKINDHIRLFYIIYGYWNNITLKPINGLIYVANSGELISKYGTNTNNALQEYYHLENIPKLTFCPYLYAASNYEKVKLLLNICPNSTCESDENRLAKHYIRNGFAEKLATNSFDKWTYLANNYKRIKSLMPRNSNGKVIWDLYALNFKSVSLDYIKRFNKTQKNSFNNIQFVKEFIDDELVNASKKLCIENAPEYFVTYYVMSKEVRYKTSLISKLMNFIKGRAADTMKQIPLNATRFMIETKCL